MEVLISIFVLSISLVSSASGAETGAQSGSLSPQIINCKSAEEFKKSFEFLRKEEGLNLNEGQVIRESLLISQGCDRASQRFQKIYTLLKKSGVDLKSSFTIALKFATNTDQMTENFQEIFKKIYLENYLNMDFSTALKYSMALSKRYEGDPVVLREDFAGLVRFCTDEKGMALNMSACAQMALQMTEYSRNFPKGLFGSFKKIYAYLRTHRQLGLDVREALKIAPRILAKGPQAPENFIKAMEYGLSKDNLKLSPTQALGLAMAVSDQSQKNKDQE